ncbi:MAG: CgeB family protein [Gaiellaceae bacterium]
MVGQIASDLPPVDLSAFDLLLTSFPHYGERFRAQGVASEYFRIGFDARVLERLKPADKREGVAFVGTLSAGQHQRGNEMLERAARNAPIDFWGRGVEALPPESAIRRRYQGEAWGIDMHRVLARTRIAVNRHIDVAEDYANNMRLYEATGVGTLLLTDDKRNLGELFEPGREIVVYSDADDLAAKIRHFLSHEDERAEVARSGQARTLRDHTYEQRMRELEAILARYLP